MKNYRWTAAGLGIAVTAIAFWGNSLTKQPEADNETSRVEVQIKEPRPGQAEAETSAQATSTPRPPEEFWKMVESPLSDHREFAAVFREVLEHPQDLAEPKSSDDSYSSNVALDERLVRFIQQNPKKAYLAIQAVLKALPENGYWLERMAMIEGLSQLPEKSVDPRPALEAQLNSLSSDNRERNFESGSLAIQTTAAWLKVSGSPEQAAQMMIPWLSRQDDLLFRSRMIELFHERFPNSAQKLDRLLEQAHLRIEGDAANPTTASN